MATDLPIDDRLVAEARRLGKHKTDDETVNAALTEYIARRHQLEILSLFGTIDYDPKYDHKCERRRRRK